MARGGDRGLDLALFPLYLPPGSCCGAGAGLGLTRGHQRIGDWDGMGWDGLGMDGMGKDGMGQDEVFLGVCQDGQGTGLLWDQPGHAGGWGVSMGSARAARGRGVNGICQHGQGMGSVGSLGSARVTRAWQVCGQTWGTCPPDTRGCGRSMGSAWMVRGHPTGRDPAGPRPSNPSSSRGR